MKYFIMHRWDIKTPNAGHSREPGGQLQKPYTDRRSERGTSIDPVGIDVYMTHLLNKGRCQRTLKWYCRSMLQLYEEMPKLAVEAAKMERMNILCSGKRQVIRIPNCIAAELLVFDRREGILSGAIFFARDGEPVNYTNVSTSIR